MPFSFFQLDTDKLVIRDSNGIVVATFGDEGLTVDSTFLDLQADTLAVTGVTTFTGAVTYTAPNVYDHNTTITAFSGGGVGSAVALTGEFNNVTTVAADFDSVILLTAIAGQVQIVKNSGASILSVFPNTSDSINALAVDLSVDIPIGGQMTFRAISDTVWETIESFYSSGPSTQNGGLELLGVDNSGNTIVRISNASHGQDSVISIPDGGQALANFLLSQGAQTVVGVQTYTAPQVIDTNTTITAFSGGGVGSAVALTGEFNNVTTVAANFDSVILLTAIVGQIQVVKNSGASILSVFPNTSDSINAQAADLSIDIPIGGQMTFHAIDSTVWETIESFYSSGPSTQNGGLEVLGADNSGNTIVRLTNASHGQATIVTIPDGGQSTANFVLSEGAATINGAKTFTTLTQLSDAAVGGTTAGTGITVVHTPGKSVFTLVDFALTVTDAGGNGGHGAFTFFTYPEGHIRVESGLATFTKFSAQGTTNADSGVCDIAVGTTATATDNEVLSGTEEDITTKIDTTLDGSGDLSGTVNSAINATAAAFDGSSTAIICSLNCAITAATISATEIFDVSGTITINWTDMGDT